MRAPTDREPVHWPKPCHEYLCPRECEGESTCAHCGTPWGYGCDESDCYPCGCPVWAANDVGHSSLSCPVSEEPATRKNPVESFWTECPLCKWVYVATRQPNGASYTGPTHDCPERHKMARIA